MSKYIIEIAEEYEEYFKGVLICGIADGKFAVDVIAREDLEELNSDYINEHFGELQDEAYQRGLEDAWEAARKLFSSMADSDIEKAFPIEWNNGGFKALMNLQPQEAIAKLKAYEDKHSDRIEVGDEVKHHFQGYGVVTRIKEVNGKTHYNAVWSNGNTGYYRFDDLKKTGKHYDIASILGAMRTHD